MFLHIDRLKKRLLPPELASGANGDRLDDRLGPLAAGIADLFDSHCGRTFARGAAVSESFPGGEGFVRLSRYPVEIVTSATLIAPDGQESDYSDMIARVSKTAGLVHFLHPPGTEDDDLVIVYSGGYWIDLSEEGDGSQPVGAVPLPRDILDAWVLQVDHEARARRLFGNAPASSTKAADVAAALPKDYDIIPRVDRVLRQYSRL